MVTFKEEQTNGYGGIVGQILDTNTLDKSILMLMISEPTLPNTLTIKARLKPSQPAKQVVSTVAV